MSSLKKYLFYLLMLQTTLLIASIPPAKQLDKSGFGNILNVSYLNVNNGLTQNSISCITQDKRGFIWIGTYDGLNCFDGLKVVQKRHESDNKYSLPDNRILSLLSEDNGNVLIGTEGGGIIVYDWKSDNFKPLDLENKHHKMQVVNAICKDKKGNIWIAGKNGILIIEHENDKKGKRKSSLIKPLWPDGAKPKHLLCDNEGNIWIGTSAGLFWLNSRSLSHQKVNQEHIYTVFQDKDHMIWYGGSKSIGMLKQIDNNMIEIPACQRLKNTLLEQYKALLISDITQDVNGIIWLTTNKGVVACDTNKEGQFFIKNYHYSENIPIDRLNCAFLDKANNLWLGSFRKGVIQLDLNSKSIHSFLPLFNNKEGKYVTTLYATDKDIWIGTFDGGLLQYSIKNRLIKQLSEIKSRSILSFYKSSQENYYVGGSSGLYQIEENGHVQLLLSGTTIRSICEDNFGKLWLATWSGIIIYDPQSRTKEYVTEKNGLSSNIGYVITKEKGKNILWYGTIGGGLNKISYDKQGVRNIKIFKHQPNSSTISNNHIWNLYKDTDDKLWVGTDAGLNLVKGDKAMHISHPMLRNMKITSITKDKHGNLWLSTGQGLVKYNQKTNEAKLYTYDNGLSSNTLTEASFITASGDIYIGSVNGLNAFNPEEIKLNPYLPQTSFTAIKIYDKIIKPNQELNGRTLLSNNIDATSEIRLKHNEDNFTLIVATLHFSSPTANRFKYRLVGLSKSWYVSESRQTAIEYSHLPAGRYKLEVVSSNNDGVWSNHYKTLNIIVDPAPWLTWWAKTIYILATGICLWLIYSYYDDKQKMRKQIFVEKYITDILKC